MLSPNDISGDLENRPTKSTKFNRVLALPTFNLNMKYESRAITTLTCRAITRVILTHGGRERGSQAGREGRTSVSVKIVGICKDQVQTA